jgi:hypothetical protein
MCKRLQFHAVLLASTLLAACGGGDPASSSAPPDRLAATYIRAEDSNAMEAPTTPVTTLASAAATPNLALYKPVSASSAESSATAGAYAVDGQAGTRWSSQFSDAQWIAVDLGAATTVSHVTLQWEAAYGKSYAVQTSTDNVNWRTVYSNGNGSGGTEDARFAPTSARWVRMNGYQRATPWGYSLYEFKVYNDGVTSANALPTDAIFAPGSFWYQPIPAGVALHPNSAGYAADFLRQVRTYYGNVTINTTAYASPVFQPPAGTGSVKVAQWDCQNKGYLSAGLAQQWASVPVPAYATPSDGSDGEMTVYQAASNTLWEFWQARKVSGQWQACWGGRMSNVSASDGIWPQGYGTTATGLPFIGGQITAEELQRGEIRHVIGIALVDLERAGIYSWPANRSDGYNPGNAANRIPEGTRFRLDPGVNVDALNLHPVARTIARAAQKYGFVVWDKAGAISLRVQNPKSYTALGQADPYAALFNGTPNYALLNGFPWDRLQFLPKDYGKP